MIAKLDEKSPQFDAVVQVAYQATQTRKTGNRDDTLFYKVVLAGNVDVIRQVVLYMQENDMQETLDWLLDNNNERNAASQSHDATDLARLCDTCEDDVPVSIHLMSVLMIILSIILTPLFYAIHIISVAIFNRDQRRISRSIQLPLAFAAFSRDDEVFEYFLSLGLSLRSTDKTGNNVFHYISDLSATAKSRALEVFNDMIQHFEVEELRELLMTQRNASGITPIEYAAKFGSPLYLDHILHQPNLLLHTEFAVGRNEISTSSMLTSEPLSTEAQTIKVELADVTMYEAGSICHRSMLLNLLSDRGVARMSEEDLKLYDSATFIGKWMALKVKQMYCGVLLFQVIDVIVTALVFVVLLRGANSSQIDVWVLRKHTGVILQEMNSLSASNKSSVLKHPNDILDRMRLKNQLAYFNMTLPADEKVIEGLLPVGTESSVVKTITSSLANESTANSALDTMSDLAIKDQSDNWKTLFIWRHAKTIRDEFIARFLDENPIFSITTDNELFKYYDYQEALHKLEAEWKKFKLDVDDYTFQPTESSSQVVSFICLDKEFFNETTDVRYNMKPVSDDDYPYKTSCDLGMLWSFHYDDCNTLDAEDLFQKLSSWNKLDIRRIMWSYVTVGILACLYLLLDMLERCIFIASHCSHQKTVTNMLATVLGSKVPGSYARRQMNVITFCVILFYILTYYYASWFANTFGTDSESVLETARYVFVIGLVIRFLLHIHSMRLLPGIGHFVITTFMMAGNLVHFSAILGLVIVMFAALFHILIDDPMCPLEKLDGFTDLLVSIFSTFKLTFGHGDFDPYYSSTPVMVTYALFVIIVSLLLMNLIIAIMSTTATEIMCEPWKEALWRVEWLDEATAVEYALCVLTSVCGSGVLERGPLSHHRAGYRVKHGAEVDGGVRVYVPHFICPALDPNALKD